MAKRASFYLQNRMALSIAEAASVVGLSENAFRTVLPEIERVNVGRRIVIPVRALERWLAERSRNEPHEDDKLAAEMLRAVR